MFKDESNYMSSKGFHIGTEIDDKVDKILYRGFMLKNEESYPCNKKMLQSWNAYKKTLLISEFYPIIAEYSIPTVLVPELNEQIVQLIAKRNNWDKVFIKSDSKSLFALGDDYSVWPSTPISEMLTDYQKRNLVGPFAIRKFIDIPEIFYNEQRFWVLNGSVYHPSIDIPQFINHAAKKLYAFTGSHYFTIDVADKYIVEVNPGESSDRGGDNPLEFFCEIFAKEFLK